MDGAGDGSEGEGCCFRDVVEGIRKARGWDPLVVPGISPDGVRRGWFDWAEFFRESESRPRG